MFDLRSTYYSKAEIHYFIMESIENNIFEESMKLSRDTLGYIHSQRYRDFFQPTKEHFAFLVHKYNQLFKGFLRAKSSFNSVTNLNKIDTLTDI